MVVDCQRDDMNVESGTMIMLNNWWLLIKFGAGATHGMELTSQTWSFNLRMHILSDSYLWVVGEWNYSLILLNKPETIQSKTVEEGGGQRGPLCLRASMQVEKPSKNIGGLFRITLEAIGLRKL